ncbi:hypothetical protein NKG94_02110 [Micromonospora sp. M12]
MRRIVDRHPPRHHAPARTGGRQQVNTSPSPATTTAAGPFTAAIETRSAYGFSNSRTVATDDAIDNIPPTPASRSRTSRLRNATIRAASSNDRAPAT